MKRHLSLAAAIAASVMAVATPASAQSTREVTVTDRSVVSIAAKLRFTTMIVLPDGEQILDLICGDKDFWIVSGAQNLAYIKPAKAGASTNLNIVSASGAVYSFVLTEGAAAPDLKVFIVAERDGVQPAAPRPRLYSAADVEEIRREVDAAKRAGDLARREAQAARDTAVKASDEALARYRATYPTTLEFPYAFAIRNKPPQVVAMYHDRQSTFIQIREGEELPAVYELKDGAASLVNLQVEHRTLIVPKVLQAGYLAIGKQRFVFKHGKAQGR